MDALGKGVDALGKDVDALGKGVDALGKAVDALGKDVDALGKDVDALGKGVFRKNIVYCRVLLAFYGFLVLFLKRERIRAVAGVQLLLRRMTK